MATELQSFGGLSLVKKDGSHSQRFPLVERRYLFGRYVACTAVDLHECRTPFLRATVTAGIGVHVLLL